MWAVSAFVAVAGVALVAYTLLSAIRSVILASRGDHVSGALVFRPLGIVFRILTRRRRTFEGQDRVMALFAPIGLVMLPAMWVTLVLIGFMGVFWGVGDYGWKEAFTISGSSLLTLGFAHGRSGAATHLALPRGHDRSRHRGAVDHIPSLSLSGLLTSRDARRPAGGAGGLSAERRGAADAPLPDPRSRTSSPTKWKSWGELVCRESHVSYPALVFFRSPRPRPILGHGGRDRARCRRPSPSHAHVPPQPQAALSIRAGYLSLRQICDYFNIPYPPDPSPDDPISISRSEFDETVDRLVADGLPVKADRDQAWRDFSGWRVNYEACVLGLAPDGDSPLRQMVS